MGPCSENFARFGSGVVHFLARFDMILHGFVWRSEKKCQTFSKYKLLHDILILTESNFQTNPEHILPIVPLWALPIIPLWGFPTVVGRILAPPASDPSTLIFAKELHTLGADLTF